MSAQLSKPSLIVAAELGSYFTASLRIPDFAHDRLSILLEQQLDSLAPVTLASLEQALVITTVWVCYCQRTFARITTGLSCLCLR
jgi:hypothetical protein